MRLHRHLKLKQHRKRVVTAARTHRRTILKVGGGFIVGLLLIQVFYPSGRLPLFASVDGVSMSAWQKSDAIKQLDTQYKNQRMNVSLGKVNESFDNPMISNVGVSVANSSRIEQASYPWYLRIIPTSLIWFGLLQNEKAPQYTYDDAVITEYLKTKLGEDCTVAAKDASLKLENDKLAVTPSMQGGSCDVRSATASLKKAIPLIDRPAKVTIPMTVIAPTVGDDAARQVGDGLNQTSKTGVQIKVVDKVQTIEQKEVLSWLQFKSDGGQLVFEINADKANAYLSKSVTPLIAKPSGVTKVSTSDFTEISRQDGQSGQTLDITATLRDIRSVLEDEKSQAKAQVTSLAPKVQYTRTYSKTSTGIAAQLKFYDDDNNGDFGVSFSELGGQGLSAQHNGDKQFVTASTYKLFVAFSTIKRVEAGQMKWDDQNIAGERDLSKCFDDMIVKSDNPCAEALIKKIGGTELNADIKSIGLTSTAFRSDNNVTTANDLVRYLTQLEKGALPIKTENRDRLLGAMKRNVYRQGVPAGASGPVADKVGFLWGLLHDATIVYSPKGTYVLVILSDGSAWANIADLTRKIEALR